MCGRLPAIPCSTDSPHWEQISHKTKRQLVAHVGFWLTGENWDEHYRKTLESIWKLSTETILKNKFTCYKTSTLEAMKDLIQVKHSHCVCVQIKWFAFSSPDSLCKHMQISFSLYSSIFFVCPSNTLPTARSCQLRQTHLTLFKSSLLTSKGITSKLQLTINLNYSRSLLNKRWHGMGFLHRNCSHLLRENLSATLSGETAAQKQDFFVYLAFEGCN